MQNGGPAVSRWWGLGGSLRTFTAYRPASRDNPSYCRFSVAVQSPTVAVHRSSLFCLGTQRGGPCIIICYYPSNDVAVFLWSCAMSQRGKGRAGAEGRYLFLGVCWKTEGGRRGSQKKYTNATLSRTFCFTVPPPPLSTLPPSVAPMHRKGCFLGGAGRSPDGVTGVGAK